MGLIVSIGQIVKMLIHQKANQAVTSMQRYAFMSLVVLRQTFTLSIPLPVMILKTGFQICLVS